MKGFKDVRKELLAALHQGRYQHESRKDINIKNQLATGEVAPETVGLIVQGCQGGEHSWSPHHFDTSVDVHLIKRQGWYIKFYFLDPLTIFISVHR